MSQWCDSLVCQREDDMIRENDYMKCRRFTGAKVILLARINLISMSPRIQSEMANEGADLFLHDVMVSAAASMAPQWYV